MDRNWRGLIVLLLICAGGAGAARLMWMGGFVSAETNATERHISAFTSLEPTGKTKDFQFPDTHTFYYLAEEGDSLTAGGTFADKFDFTGYVPIGGSSTNGYISLNHENSIGGVSVMDVAFDAATQVWQVSASEAVDFSLLGGTSRNCSGAVTAWGTAISCEETTSGDNNGDEYFDFGWCIEIDPATRAVVDYPGGVAGADKIWALGNYAHENAVVHDNGRTVYSGTDRTGGYLYRLVTDIPQDLSSGTLSVLQVTGSTGQWLPLNNNTPAEVNSVRSQADDAGATPFNGIEDVEISPIDGMIYFAVKNEDRVYRFQETDVLTGTTITGFGTYVGGMSYTIEHEGGSTSVPWGAGNDNLAFDDLGNLWVHQDGGDEYIWVVEQGHTQDNPKVELFGIAPSGSEPTGITFSPDFTYMFMSIQHPSSGNSDTTQPDALGQARDFAKDVAIVVARNEFLGMRDYGDGPDSYGSRDESAELPATHIVYSPTTTLYMGDGVTIEPDALGVDGEADLDDGAFFPVIDASSSIYTAVVTVTNGATTRAPSATANLYGWVDFDRDGAFQADEVAVAGVADGVVNEVVTLTWTIPVEYQTGGTFARLRLTTESLIDDTNTAPDERAFGPAADGEVEDYPLVPLPTAITGELLSVTQGNGSLMIPVAVALVLAAMTARLVFGRIRRYIAFKTRQA